MKLRSLLAFLSLLCAPIASAQEWDIAGTGARLTDEGFTACDAAVLGGKWSVAPPAAADRIEQEVAAGRKDALQATLQEARSTITPTGFAVCPYFEYGYSWDDADLLAKHWGLGEVYDAKARMESKLVWGQRAELDAQLQVARAQQPDRTDPGVPDPISAFFDTQLTWCDAEVLAAQWGDEVPGGKLWSDHVVEAKTWVGEHKIVGDLMAISKRVSKARKKQVNNTAICQFWSLPYTYEDAEQLASSWSISISDAKARVERAARAGKLSDVNDVLGHTPAH